MEELSPKDAYRCGMAYCRIVADGAAPDVVCAELLVARHKLKELVYAGAERQGVDRAKCDHFMRHRPWWGNDETAI